MTLIGYTTLAHRLGIAFPGVLTLAKIGAITPAPDFVMPYPGSPRRYRDVIEPKTPTLAGIMAEFYERHRPVTTTEGFAKMEAAAKVLLRPRDLLPPDGLLDDACA